MKHVDAAAHMLQAGSTARASIKLAAAGGATPDTEPWLPSPASPASPASDNAAGAAAALSPIALTTTPPPRAGHAWTRDGQRTPPPSSSMPQADDGMHLEPCSTPTAGGVVDSQPASAQPLSQHQEALKATIAGQDEDDDMDRQPSSPAPHSQHQEELASMNHIAAPLPVVAGQQEDDVMELEPAEETEAAAKPHFFSASALLHQSASAAATPPAGQPQQQQTQPQHRLPNEGQPPSTSDVLDTELMLAHATMLVKTQGTSCLTSHPAPNPSHNCSTKRPSRSCNHQDQAPLASHGCQCSEAHPRSPAHQRCSAATRSTCCSTMIDNQ